MWDEIKKAIKDLFDDFTEWLYDVTVSMLEAALSAIASIIEAIPLPDFIVNYNVTDYIHGDVLYFLTMSGFGDAMAVIGAAYTFRIIRRFVTLGIW
ncbi:hypothetical protein ACJJH9_09850 [Microbulbifer sp. DLAB2-AF]|uniref:hypothetical protein n=1 Tax=Microbulbifer sp. DLAB2-AF TaxID=3243395 RepID=UPI0040392A86